MLTLAKSLVSLRYQADEVGKGCRQGGTQEAEASGRPAPPDPVRPDSDGGWLSRLSEAGLNRTSAPQQRMRKGYIHNCTGIFHEAPVGRKVNAFWLKELK